MNADSNPPNNGGLLPDEQPAPVKVDDLEAGELMLLSSVRNNDLRMFLSAIAARGWLDDPLMKLCSAVHKNDLGMFLTALDVGGLLTKAAEERAATERAEDHDN